MSQKKKKIHLTTAAHPPPFEQRCRFLSQGMLVVQEVGAVVYIQHSTFARNKLLHPPFSNTLHSLRKQPQRVQPPRAPRVFYVCLNQRTNNNAREATQTSAQYNKSTQHFQ